MGKLDAPKGRLTMNGDDLDNRQIDGLLLYRAVLDGQTRRIAISNAQSIYLSSKDPGVTYTVERTERNRRGAKTVEYRCSCPDSAKQGRRDCQHRFAEKLLRGDVVVAGEMNAAQVQLREQIKAGRRPARQRFGYDGRSIRSVQRAARVRMSREIPTIDSFAEGRLGRAKRECALHSQYPPYRTFGTRGSTDSKNQRR